MSRRCLSIESGSHLSAEFRDNLCSHNEQPKRGSLSVDEMHACNSSDNVEEKDRGAIRVPSVFDS